jgi:hypothetical protein
MSTDMQKIKINFSDFWPGFNKTDNYFWHLLIRHFDVELSDNPEILFYSVFGSNFTKYNCLKIFYTGENIRPDFTECDYAFTFDYPVDEKNYRLPIYVLYADVRKLLELKTDIESIIADKTRFCNFIVSNPYAKRRIEFFHKLSKYKKVDSGGKVLNNIGGPVANKWDFIKNYKFTLAFENESYPGYTTEKIFEPMLFHSIPIYWGNPLVDRDFNPGSFINYHDYNNDEAVIEQIIAVDNNPDLYREYLSQPYYNNNEVNEYANPDNILRRFEEIIAKRHTVTPVSRQWTALKKAQIYYKHTSKRAREIRQWVRERFL